VQPPSSLGMEDIATVGSDLTIEDTTIEGISPV
jgi:hypothetical protein